MQGFENNVAYFQGIDTRGVRPVANQMTADGQILIGSSISPNIAAANISAGSGISISNGHNSITLSTTSPPFTWSVVTGASQAMTSNNGYIANRAGLITFTLPTVSAVGDIIRITNINTALGWTITYTTNQKIFIGNQSTTLTSGSLSSVLLGDSVEIVCLTANLTWQVISSIGNLTFV